MKPLTCTRATRRHSAQQQQKISPAGSQVGQKGQTGDFEATGKNVHGPANEKEEERALGILSEAKLVPRGWNQHRDPTQDGNFQ
jgi:hypothetical protein